MTHRRDRNRRPMLEGLEWRLAPSGGPGPNPSGGHHDVVDVDPADDNDNAPGAVDVDPADDDAQDAAEVGHAGSGRGGR